jgi:hypothetical protein
VNGFFNLIFAAAKQRPTALEKSSDQLKVNKRFKTRNSKSSRLGTREVKSWRTLITNGPEIGRAYTIPKTTSQNEKTRKLNTSAGFNEFSADRTGLDSVGNTLIINILYF